MNPDEVKKLEAYLRGTLNPKMKLVTRPKAKDSVELHLGEEFLGVIYKDTEDGETAYQLQVTILAEDL